ncbi:MAG: ATP-binding protein [Patescibacteria group bacterium]
MQLHKRKIFSQIEPYIGDRTEIVLHGARQVGKTHILLYIQQWLSDRQKKVFYYDLEYPNLLRDLNLGVDVFVADLTGKGYGAGEEVYALIDEIQYLDNPSSFLKIIADHYPNIHLVVSGSSTFDIKSKFTDSLAGRTTAFEVYPLSFAEFLEFKQVDLIPARVSSPTGIERLKQLYSEFVCYGGYPKVVLEPNEEKKRHYLLQVIDTYIRKDVRDLAHVDDISKFNNLLEVLASQSGQLLDIASVSRETTLSYPTVQKYLNILEETYVVKRVTPYSKSPSVEISKNPKVFFYDSGLQSLLWFNHFQRTILGSIFETNVFGELVKLYSRQSIHFWRTKAHQEIDFVIDDGTTVFPIEVKHTFGQFNTRAIDSFSRRYKNKHWNVVGLEGEKSSPHCIFPWEI